MKSRELHLGSNRQEVFAGLSPKVWLETDLLRTWIVADARVCAAVLRSPDMELPSLMAVVEHLEKRTGQVFKNLRLANRFIPIMLVGQEHAALRKSLALYLTERLRRVEPKLPAIVSEALQPLRSPGLIDLFHVVVGPLITTVISELVDQPVSHDIIELNLDMILTANKSLSMLRNLETKFGIAFEYLKAGSSDDMELACKICCLTFGSDTLAMTIVEGILSAFRKAGESAPAVLPNYPLETGVPLTWRRVIKNCTIDEYQFLVGDIVRLQLHAAGYSNDPELTAIVFGAGSHSCVGKQLSLRLWSHVVQAFNALALRGRAGTYHVKSSPYMTRYESIEIEII